MKLFLRIACFFIGSALYAQVPKISSFSPQSGAVGTAVTINGTGFSPVEGNNIVYFGAIKATVTSSSSTTINVIVPQGATYSPVSVTVNGLTGYATNGFGTTSSKPLVLANSSFSQKSSDSIGKGPFLLVACDFDNDGKPDIANINDTSFTVTVLKNTSQNGIVSFENKILLAAGSQPSEIVAGDINGDGKKDIVVTNLKSNTISVFRNTTQNGIISFAAKVDFATSKEPVYLTLADFDRDGKTDIASVGYADSTLSILRNIGDVNTISFASRIDTKLPGSPVALASADFDNDGLADIALTLLNTLFRLNIFKKCQRSRHYHFEQVEW